MLDSFFCLIGAIARDYTGASGAETTAVATGASVTLGSSIGTETTSGLISRPFVMKFLKSSDALSLESNLVVSTLKSPIELSDLSCYFW